MKKVIVAMSPHKSLRRSAGQADGYNEKGVIVAMSGGVDSSVAAALLKKQGYEVTGVFMRFWKQSEDGICFPSEGEKSARRVAEKLKIPFYTLDLVKEFKKEVVDYFLAQQSRGRTPNPCVVCNKKIKFGLLFDKALSMGADFLATGHYARIKKVSGTLKERYLTPFQTKLFSAKDTDKDQTYFLHQLNQRQLNRIIFPLGDYTKEEVIKMARNWKLPCRREQSFDLCFMTGNNESFIKKYLKLKPGKIADLAGNVLGAHQGLPLFTIGQRKRLPIARGPWWVVKKDEKNNILYVSNNEKDLYGRELIVSRLNWIGGQAPKLPLSVCAKIRYKSEASEAQIAYRKAQIAVKFKKPQRAITPGQSAVFYKKNGEVIGGGEIK